QHGWPTVSHEFRCSRSMHTMCTASLQAKSSSLIAKHAAHRIKPQQSSSSSFRLDMRSKRMAFVIGSITGEYKRYKALAEGALSQLKDKELTAASAGDGNSVATICWHIAGNLRSRFTDFLSSDGEKPWRRRDEEFERRSVTMPELLAYWESGWSALFE